MSGGVIPLPLYALEAFIGTTLLLSFTKKEGMWKNGNNFI